MIAYLLFVKCILQLKAIFFSMVNDELKTFRST